MPQIHENPDSTPTYSTPRWVKVFGIITTLILLFILLQFIIGGNHSPKRHIPSDDVSPTSATETHTSP